MRPIEMSPRDREEFVSRVHRAFGEKGLFPIVKNFNLGVNMGRWRARDARCCALGALLDGERVVAASWTSWDPAADAKHHLGWEATDVGNFVLGFDGSCSSSRDPASMAAYELGMMVRRAVLP